MLSKHPQFQHKAFLGHTRRTRDRSWTDQERTSKLGPRLDDVSSGLGDRPADLSFSIDSVATESAGRSARCLA